MSLGSGFEDVELNARKYNYEHTSSISLFDNTNKYISVSC